MNRELQLREVQFLAIVEYFDDDDDSTAEFVKFCAMSSDAFKENLRSAIRAKFRIDIFGGVFDVFYLDDKTEVKLNLLGDVSDFLLWIGCFFDDQLLHLTFKLRLVVRKKKAFRRTSQQGMTIQQAPAPAISLPTFLPPSTVSETRPVENRKQEEVKSKPPISNSPLFNPPSRESEKAASQKSSNDSDEDMEIALQPVEPKRSVFRSRKRQARMSRS
ncbi:Oidioi.mRNA.OKI2018_I69.PAR.g13053.t1.cds [Oikopleura dioica]|uniref:Oidioi.mRNA.OKI2018_I69.PAR.g13053.t1.cds n=1 Tax=Oikopleura dioica TaxID=34765 RepID=A0ABN7S318_OIKDI|nr:Oidioi.mRNA.OKI2018_I69.PAR.g13053.t1.cds [Oikopleura dioica]